LAATKISAMPEGVPASVVADGNEESHVCTGPPGGDCLVRSLASAENFERLSDDRLAWYGNFIDRDDQVSVGTA
jgi:hypothetical protein